VRPPSGPSRVPIPPPPPSWWQRAGVRIRRLDRAGHRTALLVSGMVGGALVAWLTAAVIGLWLQPRFTLLELGAQRLAPDVDVAEPAVEQVDRYGAFDRRYAVRFPTPDGGRREVVANARRLRWDVTTTSPDRVVLHRDGIAATVSVGRSQTLVQTRVAGWVRTRQRQAQVVAVVLGAALGVRSMRVHLRRGPRPVRPTGRDIPQNRQS